MSKFDPKNFCHHVLSSGNLCNAAPLRDQDYCYFHMMTRSRLRRIQRASQNNRPLQIGVLEDSGAIQLALVDLANAVLSGIVDPSRGYLVLQALQTAARNCADIDHFNDCQGHFIAFDDVHLEDGSEPDELSADDEDEEEDDVQENGEEQNEPGVEDDNEEIPKLLPASCAPKKNPRAAS